MSEALAGLRVVELGSDIAAPYCTKLLVDLGAEVVKIEPPTGDPLRAWGPFREGSQEHGGLFEYLNAGKHGLTLDFRTTAGIEQVHELIAGADLLVEDLPAGSAERFDWGLDHEALQRINPDLVVVRVSDYGQEGPRREQPSTSLTLQAASGWVNTREFGRAPVQAGARIPEYIVGGYAALAALTALRVANAERDRVVEADVSAFESLLSTLPYPMLMAERLKSMGLPTNSKAAPMLGIVRAADGWIGINCLTGQHWLDVCAMVGLPEFGEHQLAIMLGGPERDEFFAKAQPWLDSMAVADLVELSQAMRIPAAPINDGSSILDCPQYRDRGFFVDGGPEGARFRRPGAPFRLSKTPVLAPRPAPLLGAVDRVQWETRGERAAADVGEAGSPFAGLKVFDLSTFWAGAYLTCYLGAFGADVVKVESIQRPDGHRYSGSLLRNSDEWYEIGPLWQGTNLNKRDITLDISTDAGRELALRLAADADVVIENFSPRVVEQFGLDYDSLVKINPGVVMVRMPGFGLEGPWRDYVGWALNIEQLAGMSAVTGYPDGPPCNLQGPADPIAGVHATVALLAALEHRRRTGEGQLIEVAQIEVGAAVTAEPVIEYSMTKRVLEREGNRHRHYAQGVYRAQGDDDWVAVSVRDDTDWAAVTEVIGRPELRDDPRFVSASARLQHHDEFDEVIAEYADARSAEEVAEALLGNGVPAQRLMTSDGMYNVDQLEARGFYEDLDHRIAGRQRFPGWPFRISPGPSRHHRLPSPTLGQHNEEVLRALGLSGDELTTLRAQRVIGERLLNA
ncbi:MULTISPECIES: CoA transferase [unclassified Mycobacterium]|uniref:CaiB/BaiF CoA transferase family protein n=1 Tax=unclassified Mycobacterium TaxID=2642494 RepID=UPI00073FBE76|nr:MULTISPECIES: CoA transferase [unclassified Mycobacterium]KUH82943.1 acyl-CoA hydratase [Mycobacterium sp. IS-1556]KUH83278.1 acyl-CoA hydratase [Mycobacterium sp. GA-0227b]KUH84312.1 acyl-CoA hydratase [Mycobacterium sp. GA-1999]